MTSLPPKDVKDCLVDACMELSDKIDAVYNSSTATLLSELEEKYKDYDTQPFIDYWEKVEKGMIQTDVKSIAPQRILEPIIKFYQNQTCGSAAEAAQDIITYLATFPILEGRFTANDPDSTFIYDDSVSGHLEIMLFDNSGEPVLTKLFLSSQTTCLHGFINTTR